MESYKICLFVTGLFHLAQCPGPIHMVARGVSLLFKAACVPLYEFTTFCVPIHPSVGMGGFYLLAIVKNAAMNLGVKESRGDPDFTPSTQQ